MSADFVIAKRYAKALMVLSSTDAEHQTRLQTLQSLVSCFVSTNIFSLIENPLFDKEKQEQLIESIFNSLENKDNELKKQVSVSAVEDADIIRITVTNEDADEAAKIANEIAKVFSDKIKELYKINNINVLDQAVPDYIPSNINHTKDVIIFAFIGVVISVAYVLIANMLDTTIKSTEDIEKGFGIPVLVSIPLIDNITNVKGGKRK